MNSDSVPVHPHVETLSIPVKLSQLRVWGHGGVDGAEEQTRAIDTQLDAHCCLKYHLIFCDLENIHTVFLLLLFLQHHGEYQSNIYILG